MKEIDISTWNRQKHFGFFNALDYPHFNICANVDIKVLYDYCKQTDLSIFKAILYIASKTANAIPEFKQRVRGEKVIEHDMVHPSYTSMTEENVFTFTDTWYHPDPKQFLQNSEEAEAAVKQEASLEDNPHRDDYLFISSLPWIHFTSFVHPVHIAEVDSVPRLTWGKYLKSGEQILLPFSVQAHHALVDGWHTGEYFRLLQEDLNKPEEVFG
ncbi:MAG: chloramphenicol acetyltransferase [Bacteroidota bacterium]